MKIINQSKIGDERMNEMTIIQPGEIEIYDVVEEINREYALCIGSMKNSLEHAIVVGELLSQQKEKTQWGEWETWVKMNCNFTPRAAYSYIKVFSNRNSLSDSTSIMGAIRTIAAADPKQKKELPAPEEEKIISFSWFNDERITGVYDAIKNIYNIVGVLKTAKQDNGAAEQILNQWETGLIKVIEKIRE